MKKTVLVLLILSMANIFSEEVSYSTSETDGILLMREEEKLARDVYLKLYEVWNINVFKNISRSEQTHMDRVKTLFDDSNLIDPVEVDVPGKFKNKDLQKLYDELIKKGSESIVEAIMIGLTIEDLDIYDLEHLLSETDNEEITLVYTNLRDASIKHLQAFNRQLSKYNDSYTAQYISQEYLNELLNL